LWQRNQCNDSERKLRCGKLSGEAAEMLDENENLHYLFQKKVQIYRFDKFCDSQKRAKIRRQRYAFINFMLKT